AARRAEQREKAAALDLEREVVHRDDVLEALRDVVAANVRGARSGRCLLLLGDRHCTPARAPFSTRAPQSQTCFQSARERKLSVETPPSSSRIRLVTSSSGRRSAQTSSTRMSNCP